MSDKVQISYVILVASCAIISTVFRWRKHTRETEQATFLAYERAHQIRTTLRSQIVDSLVLSLLPIRGIYVHLSDEERLRREFALIFNKPDVVQTLSALFGDLVQLESNPRKLRYAQTVQTLTLIFGTLTLIGSLLPLVNVLMNEPINYNPVSIVMLSVSVVVAVIFVIATIIKVKLEHRLHSMLNAM